MRLLPLVALLALQACCAPPGNFLASLVSSPCGDARYWPENLRKHPQPPVPDPDAPVP